MTLPASRRGHVRDPWQPGPQKVETWYCFSVHCINAKGSSPAEMLGTGYKTVLKQGLVDYAEKNKMIRLSNLLEVNDLQKQMQGNVKVREEERNNISSLQATDEKMVAHFRLNKLDYEMTNYDSRFTSDARQMNYELEKKKNSLISVEMQADDVLKISEKRLQDARLKADKETHASELWELVDSMAEHKGFMETVIVQKRKDLCEAEDCIASFGI